MPQKGQEDFTYQVMQFTENSSLKDVPAGVLHSQISIFKSQELTFVLVLVETVETSHSKPTKLTTNQQSSKAE